MSAPDDVGLFGQAHQANRWAAPQASEHAVRKRAAAAGTMGPRYSMALNYHEKIERRSGVAGREAVVEGARVPVRTVLASQAEGATVRELVEEFLLLTAHDRRTAIAFAAASAREDLPVAEAHER
jgi:uncharacterized protein (DUF433 family)